MALRFADDSLAWVYDPVASRYRTPDGRFVGSEQITNLRNDFLDAQAERTATLAADLASGDLSLPEWEQAMRDSIKLTHGVEYSFGRGGLNQMTDADWEHAAELVSNQWDYLSGFADDIAAGDMTEEMIAARSDLYIGAAVGAYERGAASAEGVDVPVYPGDDCLGLTNCRCNWQFDAQDDGSTDCYWIAEVDACEVCAGHADEYNPLTIGGPE